MKRRIVLSLVTGMMVVGLLSGCGNDPSNAGGDDGASSTTSPESSTKETKTESKEEALTEDLSEYSDVEWPESTITSLIPKPDSMVGKFVVKSDDAIWVDVANTSDDDYKDYIKEAQDMGYTENYVELEGTYTADNENGYSIAIILDDDHVMSVIANETEENASAE